MGCVPTARQCVDYSREPFKTVALVSHFGENLKLGWKCVLGVRPLTGRKANGKELIQTEFSWLITWFPGSRKSEEKKMSDQESSGK